MRPLHSRNESTLSQTGSKSDDHLAELLAKIHGHGFPTRRSQETTLLPVMSSATNNTPRVIPAHLSYFAIYNPSLGPTDETVHEQIVFYYSERLEKERERRRKDKAVAGQKLDPALKRDGQQFSDTKDVEEAEQNERLRQVGLAQGMVDFVK